LSSARGASGQQLTLNWPTNNKVQLRHHHAFTGGSGNPVNYTLRILVI